LSPPVSACVIARDDASRIRRCLDSVAWTDERVVVLDPRSRDATESIARDCGARVLRHRYEGNLEQKNFALDQLTHEWVVALDADEALSEPLAARLAEWLDAGDRGIDGIELNRVTRHLGRWIRHGDFHPDWQLRVFRRSKGRWAGMNPHGRVRVAGEVRRIEGDLEHASYANLADQVERVREFSRVEAAALLAAGRRTRVVRDLLLRPPARFLRAYLLKAGCLDGVPGFVIAAVTAFHVFLKYAMLWELRRGGGERGPTRPA
jgi:glycosyltransferase involved in cell wall biosynthesis